MKVFISHKKEDSIDAYLIKRAFEKENVDAYLDLLDEKVSADGKELTDHIKKQLNTCTDIVVIMSKNTKYSWWVPFEIGMSAQIDMPTASFLAQEEKLPEYLSYWPRLRSTTDVKKYVEIRRKVEKENNVLYEHFSTATRRKFETPEFYKQLKERLEVR